MQQFNVRPLGSEMLQSLSRQLTCCLVAGTFNRRKFRKCIKGLNSEAERLETLELHTLSLELHI